MAINPVRNNAGLWPWQARLFRWGLAVFALSWVVGVVAFAATLLISRDFWPLIAIAGISCFCGFVSFGTVMISTLWTDA